MATQSGNGAGALQGIAGIASILGNVIPTAQDRQDRRTANGQEDPALAALRARLAAQNAQTAMSVAASQQGVNPALAQRNAQQALAQQQVQTNAQLAGANANAAGAAKDATRSRQAQAVTGTLQDVASLANVLGTQRSVGALQSQAAGGNPAIGEQKHKDQAIAEWAAANPDQVREMEAAEQFIGSSPDPRPLPTTPVDPATVMSVDPSTLMSQGPVAPAAPNMSVDTSLHPPVGDPVPQGTYSRDLGTQGQRDPAYDERVQRTFRPPGQPTGVVQPYALGGLGNEDTGGGDPGARIPAEAPFPRDPRPPGPPPAPTAPAPRPNVPTMQHNQALETGLALDPHMQAEMRAASLGTDAMGNPQTVQGPQPTEHTLDPIEFTVPQPTEHTLDPVQITAPLIDAGAIPNADQLSAQAQAAQPISAEQALASIPQEVLQEPRVQAQLSAAQAMPEGMVKDALIRQIVRGLTGGV